MAAVNSDEVLFSGAGAFFVLAALAAGVAIDVSLAFKLARKRGWVASVFDAGGLRAWSGREALLLAALIAFGWALVRLLALLHFHFNPAGISPGTQLALSFLSFHVPVLAGIWVVLKASRTSFAGVFGRPAGILRQAFIGAGLSIGALPVVWAAFMLSRQLLLGLGIEADSQPSVALFLDAAADGSPLVRAALVLAAVAVVPAAEELLFRGVAFPLFASKLGFWPAVVAVSAVFAVMHGHVPSYAPLFALSCLLCLMYAWNRSVIVAIFAHSVYNLGQLLMLFMQTRG